jgi:hypothetical protein
MGWASIHPQPASAAYLPGRPCIVCRPTDDVAGTAGSMGRYGTEKMIVRLGKMHVFCSIT